MDQILQLLCLSILLVRTEGSDQCIIPTTYGTGKQNVTFPDIDVKVNESQISITYDSKGLQPFFNLADSFMNTVQPKGIAEGFPDLDIDKIEDSINKDTILSYETPVIVAAAFGVVFMLLMPCIGFFFCLCRCCGKCGGKMYQDPKAADRHSVCCVCSFVLLILTIFMLCGALMMFVTNNRIHEAGASSGDTCRGVVNEMMEIGNQVVRTLDEVKDEQIPCALNMVKSDLSDEAIRAAIGTPVQQQIQANVSTIIDQVLVESQRVNEIKTAIDEVDGNITDIKASATTLTTEIGNLKTSLDKLVTDCKADATAVSSGQCSKLEAIKIETNVDFSSIPDITNEKQQIQKIVDQDIAKKANDAKKTVTDIPETVVSKSASARANIIVEIDKAIVSANKEIVKIQDDIKKSFLDNKDDYLDNCKFFEEGKDDYKYENYRYYAYIALSCLALWIVILLFAGLLFGGCGYSKYNLPSNRSKIATCGGNFLMAAVGFMFLLGFLLMLICVVLFALGIHFHVVCRDLEDGGIIDHLAGSKLKVNGHVVKVRDTLENCKNNLALFTAIGGDQIIDLSNKLNISDYSKDVDTSFEVDVSDQKVMTPEMDQTLTDLENSGVDSINYTKFDEELNQPLSVDLQNVTDDLGKISTDLRTAGLTSLADEVTTLQGKVTTVKNGAFKATKDKADSLRSTVKVLEQKTKGIQKVASDLRTALSSSNIFIIKDIAVVITDLVVHFAKRITYYLEQLSTHLIYQVKNNVMKCRSVSNLYQGVVNTFFCDDVIQNFNGFWLALGWCLFFFIPTLILSVRLAKYYRRMDYDPGYDNAVTYPPYNDKYPMGTIGP